LPYDVPGGLPTSRNSDTATHLVRALVDEAKYILRR
jgi:hypothetical protein